MNFLRGLDQKLEGEPEIVLTVFLIIAGVLAWMVAAFGTPTMKAAVLAWMVLP